MWYFTYQGFYCDGVWFGSGLALGWLFQQKLDRPEESEKGEEGEEGEGEELGELEEGRESEKVKR